MGKKRLGLAIFDAVCRSLSFSTDLSRISYTAYHRTICLSVIRFEYGQVIIA